MGGKENDRKQMDSRNGSVPEDDVPVLVTVSGICCNAITFTNAIQTGEHDREGWIIDGYEEWDNPNVAAWMTLPDPYMPAIEQEPV